MTTTMTILLSVCLFAGAYFVSQSETADETKRSRRERPTGIENYV